MSIAAKMKRLFSIVFGLIFAIFPLVSLGASTAEEIMKKSSEISHYAGDDRKSRMAMLVYHPTTKKPAKKIFILLRKDIEDSGRQKFFLFFTYPREIKQASFLVHKYIDEDDFRRLYLPASKEILKISGHQKQCAFMGSDFSSEDITGRHFQKDRHRLVSEEALIVKTKKEALEYATYLIESLPKIKEDKTLKTRTWVDKKTYLPVRVEFTNHEGALYKTYEAVDIRSINGYPTVTKHRMTSHLEGTYTLLFLDLKNTIYNMGIADEVFLEKSLIHPPKIVFSKTL